MIRCDAPGCVRGIVHLATGFGDPCKTCDGRGELHLAEVARLLGESETTLRRLMRPRAKMRVKTCIRILEKITVIVAPVSPKQPELF